MKLVKKHLSILLTIVMLLGLLPGTALGDSTPITDMTIEADTDLSGYTSPANWVTLTVPTNKTVTLSGSVSLNKVHLVIGAGATVTLSGVKLLGKEYATSDFAVNTPTVSGEATSTLILKASAAIKGSKGFLNYDNELKLAPAAAVSGVGTVLVNGGCSITGGDLGTQDATYTRGTAAGAIVDTAYVYATGDVHCGEVKVTGQPESGTSKAVVGKSTLVYYTEKGFSVDAQATYERLYRLKLTNATVTTAARETVTLDGEEYSLYADATQIAATNGTTGGDWIVKNGSGALVDIPAISGDNPTFAMPAHDLSIEGIAAIAAVEVTGGEIKALDSTALDAVLGSGNYETTQENNITVIKLTKDIALTGKTAVNLEDKISAELSFEGVTCIFDLNGHSIKGKPGVSNAGGISVGGSSSDPATVVTLRATGGGSVTGESGSGYAAVHLSAKNTADKLTIEGGTYTGVGCAALAAGSPGAIVSLEISGGTFNGGTDSYGEAEDGLYFAYGGVDGVITGGTFSSAYLKAEAEYGEKWAISGGTFVDELTCGQYSGNAVSGLLAPGYSFQVDGVNATAEQLAGHTLTGRVTVVSAPVPAHTHDGVSFDAPVGTFDELKALATNGGSGYLTANIHTTEPIAIAKGKTLNLCLNGHSLAAKSKGSTIMVAGTLNLYDCNGSSGSHTITVGSASHTITGGLVTGGTGSSGSAGATSGGGVYIVDGGSMTLYGGTIAGNTASGGAGGGVYVVGTFTMEGGAISYNTGTDINGGGLCVGGTGTTVFGTAILNDGTISHNTADDNGGGVRVTGGTSEGKYPTLTLSGTVIANNTAGVENGIHSNGKVILDADCGIQSITGLETPIVLNAPLTGGSMVSLSLGTSNSGRVVVTGATTGDLDHIKLVGTDAALYKLELKDTDIVVTVLPVATVYTVTFDSQSATTAADPATKTVTAPATTVVALPTQPVKTGFTFGGWFTAANGGGTEFTASTEVTADITVYAKWTANCTCTVSVPTFAGGSIEIAHDAASATQALSATGSALGGNCPVSGHADATVTYAYEEKTDANNIASVNGATLTVTGAGTVVVTATANANGVTSTGTDATFAVTKAVPPPPTVDAKWGTDDTYAVSSGSITQAVTYANTLASGTAYIQLQRNVSCGDTIEFAAGKTTVLDLNGCTLAGNHVFTIIKVTGNLTLKDSGEGGAVITGPTPTYAGSGVSVTGDGHFTLEGGKIGPTLRNGVSVNPNESGEHHAKFTMTGGSISGNKWQGVELGSNSVNSSAVFTMSGGKIFGNSIGVDVGSHTAFNMSGGEITGNNTTEANKGGGVTFTANDATVNLSGSAKITGNVKGGTLSADTGLYTGGTPNNVYLGYNQYSGERKIGGGIFTTGASIGVTVANPPITGDRQITNIGGNEDYAAVFFSDDPAYEVFNKGTASNRDAYLGKVPAYSYTVTFDSQSADTVASPVSKTVTDPATKIDVLPTPPVKDGHDFGGWFTEANGGGTEFTAATAVTADITVYAKWTAAVDPEAEWTPTGGVKASGTFAAALTAMGANGGSIKLMTAVNATPGTLPAKEITLDLNGKTLTSGGQITVPTSGTLNVTDTTNDGKGALVTGGDFRAIVNQGTLNLTGGTVSSAATARYEAILNNGILTINGGKVLRTACNVNAVSNSGTLTLTTGSIESETGDALSNAAAATANLNGGSITAQGNGVYNEGTLNLAGVAIISQTDTIRNIKGAIALSGTTALTAGANNKHISLEGGTLAANDGGNSPIYYGGSAIKVNVSSTLTNGATLVSGVKDADHAKLFTISGLGSGLEAKYADGAIKASAPTYKITYKNRAKAEGGAPFSGVHGQNYPTEYVEGETTALVDPTKEGYAFRGWYASAWGSTDTAVTEIASNASGDKTLYAKWIPNDITQKTATPDLINTIYVADSEGYAYFYLKYGAEYQEHVTYKLYTTAEGSDKPVGITAEDYYGDTIEVYKVTASSDYWLSATEDGKLESDRVKISARPKYDGLNERGKLIITTAEELAAYLNYCEPGSAAVSGSTVTQSKDVQSLYDIYFAGSFNGVWDLDGHSTVRPGGDTTIYLLSQSGYESASAEDVKLTVKNGTISGNERALFIKAGEVTLESVELNAYQFPISCLNGKLTMTDVNATVRVCPGEEAYYAYRSTALYTKPEAEITIHSGTFSSGYQGAYTYYGSDDGQTPGKTLASCIPDTSTSVPADSESLDYNGVTYEVCTQTVTVTKNGGQPAVTYTVSYDGNGNTSGTVPADSGKYRAGATVTVLGNTDALTKTDHIFAGWNTKQDGSGTTYAPGGTFTISANTTLYAKWTEVFDVGGSITDNSDQNVNGATVTIKLGNTEMGTATTGTDGTFTIADIPNGVYQLIITSGDLTVTKTITVEGSDLAVGTVKLPAGKQNSVVEVKPDTPDVVVGGLDEQFEETATDEDKGITAADKTILSNGGEVELKLTVESKTNAAPNAADIIQAAGDKTLAFLDLSVIKTVTPSGGSATETTLTELQSLLEVRIPLSPEQQGKTDYTIYRYHGTKVDAITTTANADGEKLELIDGGKTLLLWAKKFSTYAVAYTEPPVTPPPVNPGYTPSVPKPENGTVTLSPANPLPGQTVTVTPKPDTGFITDKVTVTDKDGKEIPVTVNPDGSYTYTQPGGSVTVDVSFKPANPGYTDVSKDDWFYDSVVEAYKQGLMMGMSDGGFSPYMDTSRGMIVTILWRLEGKPSSSESSAFTDVASNQYYAEAINWAAEHKIVEGYDAAHFGPEDPITREQLAAILWRYAKYKGLDVTAGDDLTGFTDAGSISDYALPAMKWAVAAGLLEGKDESTLDPTGRAIRAEAATILVRLTAKVLPK